MTMTRRDYRLIAGVIREARIPPLDRSVYPDRWVGWTKAVDRIEERLAYRLYRHDPRFDKAMFLAACRETRHWIYGGTSDTLWAVCGEQIPSHALERFAHMKEDATCDKCLDPNQIPGEIKRLRDPEVESCEHCGESETPHECEVFPPPRFMNFERTV